MEEGSSKMPFPPPFNLAMAALGPYDGIFS